MIFTPIKGFGMLYFHLLSQVSILVILILILVHIAGELRAQGMHGLEVNVTNLRSNDGNVVVCLWRSTDKDFPFCSSGNAYRVIISRASLPRATFSNVPAGKYAISVMHDEKSRENPEKSIINKPSIITLPNFGMGVSNIIEFSPRNRPEFSKAQFAVPQVKSIDVRTSYTY